ncbi:hypothetical protein K470DRAFT_296185 [Piedraia hortae CBS 480.64]|uniref:C2H2-type domain-containing protein n=1 Tax=Piedraia hortae CBS 480.64 TaxID=1314780 RepID=A0A6A7BUQ1_9PEZI|nr:hypothetical protein K470DRAFT_296185 [Piedraia hortae CBS 480.64]
MKEHKESDPSHFHCERCDLDFESSEQLTAHKLKSMHPYLTSLKNGYQDPRCPHIICELCFMEFHSYSGLKAHCVRMHKPDPNLECPARRRGCRQKFPKTADLVAHLECGRCPFISSSDFMDSVRTKAISNLITGFPQHDFASLKKNRLSATSSNTTKGPTPVADAHVRKQNQASAQDELYNTMLHTEWFYPKSMGYNGQLFYHHGL